MRESLVVALSELAARVQRGRKQADVLQIAGEGLERLGMRFAVFQLEHEDLVLRHIATARPRRTAIEALVGGTLCGLRAPLEACAPAGEVLARRQKIYRADLDLFARFLRAATGHELAPLDAATATAGICNGVVAPIFVREEPWGVLSLYSPAFRAPDAGVVALFATQVGSALEVAEYIEVLERTRKELVDRERLAALGELAAIVAHEVRNPLGAMFASIGTLRRIVAAPVVDEPHDARMLVDILDEEARRLNHLVDDLLEFARPTSLRIRRTSLGAVVSDIATSVRARPEASCVDVEVDVAPDLPEVPMDARLVRQAVFNLALNGVQAMPRGGKLVVRARTETRGARALACVDVIDTGGGIETEDQIRVFDPFFTTKAMGTGLGLPLVKRVVEAHRGVISFVSSDAGTTFTLGVPIR